MLYGYNYTPKQLKRNIFLSNLIFIYIFTELVNVPSLTFNEPSP